jgi:hypothetical protein
MNFQLTPDQNQHHRHPQRAPMRYDEPSRSLSDRQEMARSLGAQHVLATIDPPIPRSVMLMNQWATPSSTAVTNYHEQLQQTPTTVRPNLYHVHPLHEMLHPSSILSSSPLMFPTVPTSLLPAVSASTNLGSYFLFNTLNRLQPAHFTTSTVQPLTTVASPVLAQDLHGTLWNGIVSHQLQQLQILLFLQNQQQELGVMSTHVVNQDPVLHPSAISASFRPPQIHHSSPALIRNNPSFAAATNAKQPTASERLRYTERNVDRLSSEYNEFTSTLERRRYMNIIHSRRKRQRRKEHIERLNQQCTCLQEERQMLENEEIRLLNLLQTAESILSHEKRNKDDHGRDIH